MILGFSMFFINILATILGASIPMILKRLGFDPVLAAGPFITTMNDVLGLLVYLGIASMFLTHLSN